MKNYIETGDVLTVPAPEAADSGEFLVVGEALFGVAGAAAENGADVAIHRRGVFTLPKLTGEAWTLGDKLYWVTATKNFSTTPTANVDVGAVAMAAALSGDTTGRVLIGV